MSKVEEFQFQAEMSQLLHLITHSLYSHREIFLRELVSNASDALNKLHFAALTDSSILGEDGDLKIQLTLDEEKKSLTISDNGIGMNKDELIANIGTIANSGTSNFMQNMTGDKTKDIELIGRFGVGFYAVFMVSDEVTVESRSYQDEKGWRWISNGTGSFTIEEIEKPTRGTSISFTLKEDAAEFATKWKVDSIIKKYSDFVSFPIFVGEEQANKSTALWARSKDEVTEEEYKEFFGYIAHSGGEPMSWQHLSVEAPVQFNSILYIPTEPDRFNGQQEQHSKVHLYVKRVFIQNDCKDLLPPWLRFVQGVVDSEDLTLNVSREVTQDSPVMAKIQKYLVKKIMGELSDWAKSDKEKYDNFWSKFGNFIKEGIHADPGHKEKLLDLYRAQSSNGADAWVSLQDYVDRMKDGQEEIYYVYGKNRAAIESNPNLEYFKKNEIEVLYITEEIDDFVMPTMGPYLEKQIVGIDKADLKLDAAEDEPKETESEEKTKNSLIDLFKTTLGDKVSDVTPSNRLVDSACTLVSPKEGMNANMERMMKMMDQNFQGAKRVMEINLKNPLIQSLGTIQEKNGGDPLLTEMIDQLFESASLLEGSLEDPAPMAARSAKLMEKLAELYQKNLA